MTPSGARRPMRSGDICGCSGFLELIISYDLGGPPPNNSKGTIRLNKDYAVEIHHYDRARVSPKL